MLTRELYEDFEVECIYIEYEYILLFSSFLSNFCYLKIPAPISRTSCTYTRLGRFLPFVANFDYESQLLLGLKDYGENSRFFILKKSVCEKISPWAEKEKNVSLFQLFTNYLCINQTQFCLCKT